MIGENPAHGVKEGLLPTSPLPADLKQVDLTDNARQVLSRRYVRRGKSGEPIETVEEMFWRVAYHIARVEEAWAPDTVQRTREFYQLLTTKCFFPNSPTFTGAGTPLGQLAACFVLPIADDMGRHPAGIFQSLRDAALIQQTGGGNGFGYDPHFFLPALGKTAAELDRQLLLAHALALEGRPVAHRDRDLDRVDLDAPHLDRPRGHVLVADVRDHVLVAADARGQDLRDVAVGDDREAEVDGPGRRGIFQVVHFA